jgi:Tol biopolymer transport system component
VCFDEVTRRSTTLPINVPQPREPVISHDGRSLAFVSGDALFLFDGHTTRRLAGAGHGPSFGPGDNEVVFANEGKVSSIRAVELSSGHSTTIMEDSSELTAPSVSPDGRHLLFAARRNANWQVWVREILSGTETKITGGNCNNFSPVWDGSGQIVFASDCRRGLGLPALFRAPFQ